MAGPTARSDESIEAEGIAAYRRLVTAREAVARGERTWGSVGEEFFTDDAIFVDPAWGRVEGRGAIVAFMDESMAGLDDWTFPEVFTMADGPRVVSMWMNRLGGRRADGSAYEAPGVSILVYAGGGRFSYEIDILNMAHVGEVISEAGWRPPANFNMPPSRPDRSIAPLA